MKYKVTNKLEQPINFGKIKFMPKETKILEVKPESDRFEIIELNENKINIEEPNEHMKSNKPIKGGK